MTVTGRPRRSRPLPNRGPHGATPPEIALDILTASGPSADVARVVGVNDDTVRRLLAKFQPVSRELITWQRDHFVAAWQHAFLSAYEQLVRLGNYVTKTMAQERYIAQARKDASITMSIATEKSLLLHGQPTAIVANLHEVRINLPALMTRLARVGESLQRGGHEG